MGEQTKLVRTAEAARALSVDPSTLSRWAQKGLVHPKLRTAGGQARWDLDDLREQVRTIAEKEK
ncbi:MerR family transcriptional regulator [Pseudonocardia alni]|uniref:MerR family transcriptional regulator n=1 Tax=Pseudonocardia alni TaxID=33907 RepID=UPI00280A9AA4|nr:MerR family transcriptional regulator [Pseudonocardia alni]